MTMQTSQFESVKVALKQDKTGFVLTLSIHPDDLPEEILRDFVGARYQVVMVRLNNEERPMNREQEHSNDGVRTAVMLCRDSAFHKFLYEGSHIFIANEEEATNWLKEYLDIKSRAEIKESNHAIEKLRGLTREFTAWKTTV
jgi:hypothetical protein